MTTANGWAYYYKIRTSNDHMDTLKLYKDYKSYWDKHRIPGETKLNEVLWEDIWWKKNSPGKRSKKLPPLRGNASKKEGKFVKSEVKSAKTPPLGRSDEDEVEKTSFLSPYATLPEINMENSEKNRQAAKDHERHVSSSDSSSENEEDKKLT
ncbi:unnamed protein product [Clavelina lepadiformis]|uniref:Uncharacterized protein n=1 Tax=Clavelina lepadiformis TaxID=159417 RepID=A0ABP0G4B8_CLALP